ncbi:TfoX/Sxy family protein [Flavobacterium sp. 7A]|uniref:TfoX/Sxy family protein n=1 Tax=Flavobacterium sp. 7A TaxID=2940571 RepID=UPI0022269DE2|nr:TfoX/Sxy family protein [Flavobacterium sp. 7A]MCW2118882.1 TfoX/Sxy family transcriptional regulator of competence genes [Flavobacterium sp. 7A]
MAYNELLALRIEKYLFEMQIDFIEKKMFGGISFMIADKMCIGVMKDEIMLRVMEEFSESLLEENHVKPMNFTGKSSNSFLFIEPEGFASETQLKRWIELAIDFGNRGHVKTKKKKKE